MNQLGQIFANWGGQSSPSVRLRRLQPSILLPEDQNRAKIEGTLTAPTLAAIYSELFFLQRRSSDSCRFFESDSDQFESTVRIAGRIDALKRFDFP
jgi:hypothetical protein